MSDTEDVYFQDSNDDEDAYDTDASIAGSDIEIDGAEFASIGGATVSTNAPTRPGTNNRPTSGEISGAVASDTAISGLFGNNIQPSDGQSSDDEGSISNDSEEDEEDDDDDEDEDVEDTRRPFQKLTDAVNDKYLVDFHSEAIALNYTEVLAMSHITRDSNGIPVDPLHRSIPFLTKYEKTRILGQRAKQINAGAHIFVRPPEQVIDGYEIAKLELLEKRIPFIIRRPMPNGGSEYWRVRDLENVGW